MATKKTERQKQLDRFRKACNSAAAKRAANRGLRQQYREDSELRNQLKTRLVNDLLRVYDHPDNPYKGWAASRKRYRELGHFPEIIVTDLFGTHAEFERAAGLRDLRNTSKVRNLTARLHTEKKIREYAEQEVMKSCGKWDKRYRKTAGVKHVLVGSDFHSQLVDPFALRVWLWVAKHVQPDGVIFNGDVVDFPSVGRYSQMPGAGNLTVAQEIKFVKEHIFAPTRAACPNAWATYHVGNHEQRLVRYVADTAPALADLPCMQWDQLFGIEDHGIEMVFGGNWMAPTQRDRKENVRKTYKVYYDQLMVMHGVSVAKDAWEKELIKVGMPITCGHTHRPAVFYSGTLANPNLSATHTGMMAGYAVGKDYSQVPDSTNWTMGFALFTIDPGAGVVIPQPIIVTEEFATFSGHVFRPTERERQIRLSMWGEDGHVTAHTREGNG